jgi:Protein of unknown function (DUF2889)
MPFVSDIAGPQQPIHDWPRLTSGALRRTSTIDTHPDGPTSADVDLRARDVTAGSAGDVEVIAHTTLRAHLTDRAIDEIDTSVDERLSRLRGCRVGPGFRATVGDVLGDDVERSTALALLLDDWAGASLVSGYSTQHAAITTGTEQKLPDGVADRMAGICAGFALDASLIGYARDQNIIPCVHGPLAPRLADDPDAMHSVEPLRVHGMRRMRRLDLNPGDTSLAFDAHFRDTHVDESGVETIVHEYSVVGLVDRETRILSGVTATVRVLPWQECPGAIGSAGRVNGMAVGELRNRIRTEFVGTSTCTHLNDTLRALGDLGALLDVHNVRYAPPSTSI